MRIAHSLLLLLAAVPLAGCTSAQLANNTVTQAHSHTDILYRQVLDNVAASECNPDVLPHFSVIGSGGTQVLDEASAQVGLAWDARSFIGSTLGLGATREFEDNWQLAPVTSPDRLRALRAAFQIVTRGQTNDPAGFALLNRYLGPDDMPLLQPGWYGVGCKGDVPSCACYVSHCGDRYVWVTAAGLDGLSQLTLAVLTVASIESRSAAPATGETRDNGINTWEGPAKGERSSGQDEVPLREFKDFYYPLPSQIQLGR